MRGMDDKQQPKESKQEETVELVEEVDQEALSVIFRLYDKTIKDLVDR